MSNPATASIYALIDPRDGEIRYIGLTRKPLDKRLGEHMREKRWGKHRTNWIQKLRRMGLRPRIDLVQIVPVSFVGEAEIYWISYFRDIGCRLLNDTDGGQGGMRGYQMSNETRAKISERSKQMHSQNPNLRLQIGRLNKGKPKSEEWKRRQSTVTKRGWIEG